MIHACSIRSKFEVHDLDAAKPARRAPEPS
jgi:hypothetical protein